MSAAGWADVATKRDLSELERRIDLRFDSVEDRLTARFARAMRTYFVALLSSFAMASLPRSPNS